MPGKDHRAASRQARLRDSRRRRVGSPTGSQLLDGPVSTPAPMAPVADDEGESELDAMKTGTPRRRASALGSGKVEPVRRTRRSSTYAAPPATQFVGGELRQIAIITTLIVAILIACTFVLG
ncbi:MAG: hypothetical protein FJ319_11380 [SAR202 cluster bacterium]|nr:hypothetical protein [SAR202 cluster bacterium]